jgi:hypothetical protein
MPSMRLEPLRGTAMPGTPDESQLKKPAPSGQAREFWTATFLIALGLIALFSMVAFGAAWLLD